MTTQAQPIEYDGKRIEFVPENPEEAQIPDEELHRAPRETNHGKNEKAEGSLPMEARVSG